MPIKLAMLGLLRGTASRPFAKAYIKPLGRYANPADSAVNPLVLMGLMYS
jgi:hypothetical protein